MMTMKMGFRNFWKTQSIAHLFFIPKIVIVVMDIAVFFLIIQIVGTNNLLDILVYGSLAAVLECIVWLVTSTANQYIADVVNTELNLEKYRQYINYEYHHSFWLNRTKRNHVIACQQAVILYLEGNFHESLEMLQSIKVSYLPSKLKTVRYYYLSLCQAHLGQEISSLAHLSPSQVEWVEIVTQILKGEVVEDNFESYSQNKLLGLAVTFYRALNERNQGNAEREKEHLETTASETANLFYVREARKYLEEL
ncbi:TPA: hypothetical protein TXJ06_000546 [Streptococcus suis]|nr:hypothetical protein [Streptococcus suis]